MYIRLIVIHPQRKYTMKILSSKIGEPERIRKGKKIILFSSGAILDEVLNASEILKKNKIFPTIINIHTLKPINKKKCS